MKRKTIFSLWLPLAVLLIWSISMSALGEAVPPNAQLGGVSIVPAGEKDLFIVADDPKNENRDLGDNIEAHSHWYGEWRSSNNGTHQARCRREGCDVILTSDCFYLESGICVVCGHKLPASAMTAAGTPAKGTIEIERLTIGKWTVSGVIDHATQDAPGLTALSVKWGRPRPPVIRPETVVETTHSDPQPVPQPVPMT